MDIGDKIRKLVIETIRKGKNIRFDEQRINDFICNSVERRSERCIRIDFNVIFMNITNNPVCKSGSHRYQLDIDLVHSEFDRRDRNIFLVTMEVFLKTEVCYTVGIGDDSKHGARYGFYFWFDAGDKEFMIDKDDF